MISSACMYAMGPDENYCDWSKGARLGWNHGTVSAHKEYLVLSNRATFIHT